MGYFPRFRVLVYGVFSAVPCFSVWGIFRRSAVPPFHVLGSPPSDKVCFLSHNDSLEQSLLLVVQGQPLRFSVVLVEHDALQKQT